ncbi:metallophosphoesterase family protein [Cohnella nanjingensis]|uniref:Metallophosphoesterase n=1 Tax=Cohnella nanjingensis TaxID=1387779 RepID=A0A7X0RXT7_9BACL|nr:metallophosphoesterase [Cohnella nanjingensis]MBB6674059.1 metallophosphoesterase [Cohnella nanjingensis]
MRFEHIPTPGDKQAVIRIAGLSAPVTLLHVTDSHMNETDGREGADVLAESYRQYSFDALAARTHFDRALAYARELSVDGVALTGDLFNGATANNLDHLAAKLQSLGIPWLYTLGNHDWEFPGFPWCESTRQAQYPKFERLTGGNPACSAREIQGVLLLAVDNSTYQITEEQLAFVQRMLARGLPTLLFMHIPLYIPSLLSDVMREWRAPIMMAAEGWDDRLMMDWQVEKATDATLAYVRLLRDNRHRNLIGLFCGHVHFAHRDAFGRGSCQYVTQAGFSGGYRVIRLLPAE